LRLCCDERHAKLGDITRGIKTGARRRHGLGTRGCQGDGLLEALLTELDRSKAQLKMDQVQAPYYVEYRVDEVEDFGAEAAYGALRENQRIHVRVLRW